MKKMIVFTLVIFFILLIRNNKRDIPTSNFFRATNYSMIEKNKTPREFVCEYQPDTVYCQYTLDKLGK